MPRSAREGALFRRLLQYRRIMCEQPHESSHSCQLLSTNWPRWSHQRSSPQDGFVVLSWRPFVNNVKHSSNNEMHLVEVAQHNREGYIIAIIELLVKERWEEGKGNWGRDGKGERDDTFMQCKAKQSKATQSKAMQCNATQCKAKQCKANAKAKAKVQAKQTNAKQRNANQGNAKQGNAKHWGNMWHLYL